MAAGDQIGIPALESSVHRLQRNSSFAAFAAIVLEVFAGVFVAPSMRREESWPSNLRFVVDTLFGTAVVSVATVVCCFVFFEIASYR
jgi:RsiW-degrading membrane proteinase PrsW (M82 family)